MSCLPHFKTKVFHVFYRSLSVINKGLVRCQWSVLWSYFSVCPVSFHVPGWQVSQCWVEHHVSLVLWVRADPLQVPVPGHTGGLRCTLLPQRPGPVWPLHYTPRWADRHRNKSLCEDVGQTFHGCYLNKRLNEHVAAYPQFCTPPLMSSSSVNTCFCKQNSVRLDCLQSP